VIGRSPLGTALSVLSLLSIPVAFLVPPEFRWPALGVMLLLILANFAHAMWWFRAARRAAEAVVAAHPGRTAMVAGITEREGSTRSERARVVAVTADRGGLSFRDRSDIEVLHLAAGSILSLELAPLDPRTRLRPARVTLADGAPVSFWLGVKPDALAEAIVELRTALGRAAG
jgi:hypothetical protein